MEEVDVQDDNKRKEEAEQQDGENICLEKEEKTELRDDDSFEVISLSGNGSSKYSASGDSDEDDALVISINDSMNKSFPEVQLLSDLVESTPSSITLIPENVPSNDKYISPKVESIPEVRCESFPDDDAVSAFSQSDESSSIVVMGEPSEMHEPVLNIEHASVPSHSQSIQEDHPVSQVQLEESENVLSFHGESSSVVSNPADVLEKSSTSNWAVCSDVNMTEGYPNISAMMESHEGNSVHGSLHTSVIMESLEGNSVHGSLHTSVMMESLEGNSVHGSPHTSAMMESCEGNSVHTSLSLETLHSVFVEEQFKNYASGSALEDQAKGSDVVNSDDRNDSPVKTVLNVNCLPEVQNSSTGLWGWLCPKNLMHKLIDKAWASIDTMINTLDPQMKNVVKPDFEVLITTTSDFESWPIRKAFRKTFLEKAGITNLSVTLGCVPTQPVGFRSGLYCAEKRIKFMREHKLVDESKIIVATSPVLVEVTPLRWHHTTCIMLDDPHLGLTLHTFTQTVPVPNVYVSQVQLRTPSDYHLKHLGFNITVGRVISIMTGMPENDWQYAMTGTSFNKILESAAVVLAGMYKSYLDGVSY